MIYQAHDEAIKKAADLLHQGELVVFPTETVYGLGADATSDQAVAKIYALKGRPAFNPLICHVLNLMQAQEIAQFDDRALALAHAFWPGPLTLILPKKSDQISALATAGLETIAMRVPSHPIARKLLQAFGGPLVAPSANPSGELSPTTAYHVAEAFGQDVPMVLAGGQSEIGVESTILDLSTEHAILRRPGAILPEQIRGVIGVCEVVSQSSKINAPGQMTSHYAPRLPVRLNAETREASEAFLGFGPTIAKVDLNLSPNGDLVEAAKNLFAMLRLLDQDQYRQIAVMPIPDVGLGAALNDRLKRAAAPR